MSDFNQTQDDLSAFLEKQFAPQVENTEQPKEKETDDEINQFLAPADDDVPPPALQGTAPTTPQQPVVSDQERLLQLERELAATRTRAQMYEQALQQRSTQEQPPVQKPATPTVAFADDEIKVDERYKTDYGDADPYIASIAKRVANDMYQRTVLPLQQELDSVRGQLQSQAEFNQAQRTDTLHMQLKSVVPDIDTIVRTPEWQSYIKQPDLYGSGRTIASYVQEGIQYGNVKQLAQIAQQFKQTHQQSQPQLQHVSPGRAQTTVPNTAPRRGSVYRMSEFDRATQAFQAGKLSWDKYQVVVNEFNDAMLDGRVNYNK